MNWDVGIDGNDFEFVLALPRAHSGKVVLESCVLDTHAIWMLDFDCCNSITLDKEGAKQIARAFWRNDPYFPRPGGEKDDRMLRHALSGGVSGSTGVQV